MLEWLSIFDRRGKIGFYCSDVSGAFDKVDSRRLAEKLRAKGINQRLVNLLISWCEDRNAKVAVGGCFSEPFKLANQVFQGTVLGPILGNLYFEDSCVAIRKTGHNEVVFADDLNAWKEYKRSSRNTTIFKQSRNCQAELHEWGRANAVTFDSKKEHFSVLSREAPEGPSIKLLGVSFDTKLKMECAVATLVNDTNWKLRTLLRTRKFFDTKNLIQLFKMRILGYVEYRTAATHHASATALGQLDLVYNRLLQAAGLTKEESLLHFGLAPLNARRVISMLGIIHRIVLGGGPDQFKRFFILADDSLHPSGRKNISAHNKQLRSYRNGQFLETTAHSSLGAIDVYNLLPEYIVAAEDISTFQNRLQQLLKAAARDACPGWSAFLSNRHLTFQHPLLRFGGFVCRKYDGNSRNNASVQRTIAQECTMGWLNFGQGMIQPHNE